MPRAAIGLRERADRVFYGDDVLMGRPPLRHSKRRRGYGSALCGTLRKQSVGFKPPFFKGWLKPCPQSQPLVPKIQPSVVNDEGLYLVGEDGFGPRTKKQSTGLFFASSTPCCPHLIFSSQKYDPPPYRRRVILGGRGWIRTIEAK